MAKKIRIIIKHIGDTNVDKLCINLIKFNFSAIILLTGLLELEPTKLYSPYVLLQFELELDLNLFICFPVWKRMKI